MSEDICICIHDLSRSRKNSLSLQNRHNGCDSVSNQQPHDCLLNRLFRRRSKKTSKLRVTGLCAGNSPGTDEFPAQMASNAENVSIWWRHHGHKSILGHRKVIMSHRYCTLSRARLCGPFSDRKSIPRYCIKNALECHRSNKTILPFIFFNSYKLQQRLNNMLVLFTKF